MAIQLTSLLQHANTVAGSGQKDQAIYIKQNGSISKDSGLAQIKHPTADQKKTENQATLEAFKQAIIEENPMYESLLIGEGADYDLATFFTTKHQQGTPLTAKDVQTVKGLMDMAYATSIGKMLAGADMLHGMDATSFAWFCVGKGLNLNGTEGIREALKQFYIDNYCAETISGALRAAGIPEDAIGPATKMLLKSDTLKDAMGKAFVGDLTGVTKDTIIKSLGQELGPVCKTMVDVIRSKPEAAKGIFTSLSGPGKEGRPFFDGVMHIVKGGGLPETDTATFFHQCRDEHTDLTTPESRSSALRSFLVDKQTDKIMGEFAVSNGMPKKLGENLSHLPPLKALIQKELSEIVAPPAVPTQAQIEQAIDRAGSIFLADKGETIQKILSLATLSAKDVEANPALSKLTTKPLEGGQCVSEARLLEMMNAMLYADTLLDKLLAPESGADMGLINALRDFQDGTESCQHTVPGTFGGPELMDLSQDALLLMMISRGAKPEDMEKLLLSVNTGLRHVALGMESLRDNLTTGKLTSPNRFELLSSLPYLQNAMRKMAQFAYDMVPDDRKTALGITTDAGKFFMELEEINKKSQPLSNMHQSVRDFAVSVGVKMNRVGYAENKPLATATTNAYTGPAETPKLTPLFLERAQVIATELGLTDLNVADLDPVTIGSLIQRALDGNELDRLTEAQARAIADGTIRDVLTGYKDTLEFIKGLPTEYIPANAGKFIITPEEKTMLLRIIPGSTLRDPELIKAVVLESRALAQHVDKLLTPGMNATDMARFVMEMSSIHVNKIGKLALSKSVDAQRHGAMSVAMQLTLGAKHLTPDQAGALYDLVSGNEGKLLGGAAVGMTSHGMTHKNDITNFGAKMTGVMGTMTMLDSMRLILGRQLGKNPEENPFYYTEIPPRKIRAGIITDMAKVFGLNSKDIPGYEALTKLTPPLTDAQWGALLPMMGTIAKGIEGSFECDIILRMVAVNAPELAAARERIGKDLTPAQIWEVVIGGKPPKGLTAENLGETMHRHATATLLKLGAQTSQISPESMKPVIEYNLGQGIPFKKIVEAMKPGGKLTLADIRFGGDFGLSSLGNYTADNAYGLTTDFRRRASDKITGMPSTIRMEHPDGHGVVYTHMQISTDENTAANPLFQDIITHCRELTSSEIQFQRVMQCLSQASTVNMRMLSEMLPGQFLSEHAHANATAQKLPNGDVVVEITNGENVKPIGGQMKILVDVHGKVTVQELSVEFK